VFSKYRVTFQPPSPVTIEPIPDQDAEHSVVPESCIYCHLIPPSLRASTCSASPATVNHVTISSRGNPNPRADPPGAGCCTNSRHVETRGYGIKNQKRWKVVPMRGLFCHQCSISVTLFCAAPPSPLIVFESISGKPARFCPNGYYTPSSHLKSWQRLLGWPTLQ
jgi:hypothetical protein